MDYWSFHNCMLCPLQRFFFSKCLLQSLEMTAAEVPGGKCLLPTYTGFVSPWQPFKVRGVKKLIECATERQDNETCNFMKCIFYSQGEKATFQLHKNSYCSYTSKMHMKRKNDSLKDTDESPVTRIRRSQVIAFDFKSQCLFCAEPCKLIDPKHPDRWDRVVQCERKGAANVSSFKEVVLNLCADRNDVWSREVAIRCHGVHELAAAEALYHLRCYDKF